MAGPASACGTYFKCPGKARCVCAGPPAQGLPPSPEYVCLHPCPAFLRDTTSYTSTCISVRYFMSCLPFLPDISRPIFTHLTIPLNRHYAF